MADGKNTLIPRGPMGVYKALVWSLNGLKHAFLAESSFRLECYLFVIFAPMAFWLGNTPLEKAVLFGTLILVLVAELLNSSVVRVNSATQISGLKIQSKR